MKTETKLRGKKVVLCVSGGIAAYKSAFLTRELMKRGALVKVVMTRSAQEFVTPLTFRTLTEEEVVLDTFQETAGEILHIALARWADLVVVAPATANVIGKMALGIADDFLSTFMLAVRAPILVCPAMNTNMLTHPAVENNMETLRQRGVRISAPGVGKLACKEEGAGRLADVSDIMEEIECMLNPQDLKGVRFLITASRTEEYFDPVRCLTNRSSGKMGFAVAVAARRRGGEVCLISGPSDEPDPAGVEMVRVVSALDMREAVLNRFAVNHVVIKAAAVSDFRPALPQSDRKIKRGEAEPLIRLEMNPDILAELGRLKTHQCLVGFAAETTDLLENAMSKIRSKQLDFIVANDVSEKGSGFRSETNRVKIIDRDGAVETLPMMDKIEVGHEILSRVRRWLDLGKAVSG